MDTGRFRLVHPACVAERQDDVDEANDAWRAGAVEEARDMLRFALEGCGDNIGAHVALGRIALDHENNLTLARGHFGYAVEIGLRPLRDRPSVILPPGDAANRPLFEAIEGMCAVYRKMGQAEDAAALEATGRRLAGDTG